MNTPDLAVFILGGNHGFLYFDISMDGYYFSRYCSMGPVVGGYLALIIEDH